MPTDQNGDGASTRREYVKLCGMVLGAGLLAGCTGDGGADATPEPTDRTVASPPSPTETQTDESTPTDPGSYTVSMAPMGDVEFEDVPTSIFTRLTHEAGMAFALGRGNDVNAMHAPDYYHALWNQFTPRLPGVELDWSGLYSSWEPTKEKLYELDSDVHLADPAGVFALSSWTTADLEEVESGIGPWFGNQYSARNAEPPTEWADRYEYYGLWEMFENVAAVFREESRYEALFEIRNEVLATIEADLPPEDERPTAVMGLPQDLDQIYVYKVTNPGFLTAHLRPFGVKEAFGDDVASGATVDVEGLLEADPDVILANGGMHPETDMVEIRSNLESDPGGKKLSAVQNGRLYAQGARYQGPILNLFQLEMSAKQLYPDQFGEWPTYEEGPYPEIPAEEQLFDRDAVADVVTGAF